MTLQDWHDGFKAIRRLKLPIKPGRYKTRNGRVAVVTRTDSYIADGYLEPRGKAKQRASCWHTKDGRSGRATIKSDAGYWDLVERLAR